MTTVAPPVVYAGDVMTTPVLSVSPETSIAAAWSVMLRSGLRHLVVCADHRCVGVVDDRSIFAQWPMGPLALRRHCVRELMRPHTVCVLPSADIADVATVMMRESVDAVPVVGPDGDVIGIVTVTDVIAAVASTACE